MTEQNVLWIRGGPGVGKSTMAGYFVDVLKHDYPNAVVAYFFCKSGQTGLMHVRDIVRTISYQCVDKNPEARALIKALKMDFPIDGDLSVQFVFRKLLQEPLSRISKDIYMVLDGLDEVDSIGRDSIDRRQEVDILISNLASLCSTSSSTRLLIISRPQSNVKKIVSKSVTRSIEYGDNAQDIQTYVKREIRRSAALQWDFQIVGVDPFDFFRKANGIFLWVVLVLQQLSGANSLSTFQKCLDSFSEASGDMKKVYLAILSTVRDEDRKWVREILYWMIVAKRQLKSKELKAVVEGILRDQLRDFEDFLKVECGSILHCLPVAGNETGIQLIHETFQSFIIDSDICPKEFFIDQKATQAHAAAACLQYLSGKCSNSNDFNDYVSQCWADHLCDAEDSSRVSNELLMGLHQFFTSDRLALWIRDRLRKESEFSKHNNEELTLHKVSSWLRKWEIELDEREQQSLSVGSSDALEPSIQWRAGILNKPEQLGEYVGKAAVGIWLYEDVNEFQQGAAAFLLGLKYYWRREGRSKSNLEELRELSTTKFKGIMEWMGSYRLGFPKQKNLGVAFAALRQWSDSISNYRLSADTDDDDPAIWEYLGDAYREEGNYDGAINAYEKAIEKNPSSQSLWRSFMGVYEVKRDYDGLIKVYEKMIEANPNEWWKWKSLGWVGLVAAYKAKGDMDGVIRVSQNAVGDMPTCQWLWNCLSLVRTRRKGTTTNP